MDRQQHYKKEKQHLKAVWHNGGCSAWYYSFVVAESSVLKTNPDSYLDAAMPAHL